MKAEPLAPSLAGALTDLWNRCLGREFPARQRLLEQCLWGEPNFDATGSRAVCDGNRLIAALALKRRQVPMGVEPADGRGWISVLLVDPAYQGQGIGSRLLAEGRDYLRRFSTQPVFLGSDPGHFFPGIPLALRGAAGSAFPALDWFARRGAHLGTPVCDLVRTDLQAFVPPERVRALPGVSFRPALAADRDALLAFLRAEFPDRWTYEAERHFALGGRPEDVMLALAGGSVIGFARLHCPESTFLGPGTYWAPRFAGRHGGLGPIGVGAGQRGRGLGLALLAAGLAELRQRGITSAVIDWTDLVTFYGLVGFRPWQWYTMATLP